MKLYKIIKYILFPRKKFSIIFPQRMKSNDGAFTNEHILLNNKTILQQKAKYFRAPTDLYKATRSIVIETNVIYFTRNQKGFNSFLFKKKFDVIITDKSGKVLKVKKSFKTNKISRHFELGYYVYFLPIGTINYYKIKENDLINFRRSL